ncbi:MAG TPA: ABC transporter ATP-binding protein [Deltaproteobacteria bacterium]|nr:ABC transporter [Deltaproteobacteria bacterium]HIA58243.1 ABC transporter ATP-binding protein [Candidatus Lambdaproteobacteria bacterium]HIB93203.1 ABC transporter ATP-binding protein [Candidatus Lambdaproteobacteria bacterium]HIN46711.1 ABC transporter ATP-binding protein [Deltaproteobacteria bacterium]HIO62442.1 ABC transporter ATP-binding protein [Deltaproteobacteria bacterium]
MKEEKSSHIARRLFGLIAPLKGWVIFSIVCMAGYNIFTAAPAYYAKDIVDTIAYGDNPELKQYFLVGIGLMIVFAIKGLFFFGHNYSVGHLVQSLIVKLRQQLFDHLVNLSLTFFTRSKTGDLISRFTNDLHVFQNMLQVGVTGPFRDIPQFFLLLSIMFYRSWQLAFVTMILIPVAVFFIQIFGQRNKIAVSKRQISFGGLSSLLVETISGVRVVKAFGMEKYESKRFKAANDDLYKNHMRSVMIDSYSYPIIEIIGAAAGATIVAYGGYLIINDQITPGDFTSFVISFFMLNEPVKKLNGFNLKLQEGFAAVRRIFDILDIEDEIVTSPNAKKITGFNQEINLNIKAFHYPDKDEPAVRDFQLRVQKGEAVALVGSSGSGKTTIANLIPRFYDITRGEITIDGNDLRDLDLVSLRKLIAIVTQDTILFNDTIASNITYGQPDCSKERMYAAARAANAHTFIKAQPDGYETEIGEKGGRLSGGQRQRLSIARALVKDAPILILDEATSALDSESEIEVQQAIEHLMENRTTIVIAHRLSTIRNADRICVMENGEIVEQGTHDELLSNGGRYQQLYEMQFQDQPNGTVSEESKGRLVS